MKFSIKEIRDMAIELEITGSEFYTQCAEKYKSDTKINELFTFLAKEEEEHKKIFESMFEKISNVEGDFTDEYFEYLSAIISGRVFKNKDDIKSFLNNIKDIKSIFDAGIAAEKDSILFYHELLEMYSDSDKEKNIINTLINAEKAHLKKLILMKVNV